jgi:cytochrome c-type biogenesis protein CcmH/NrfG
LSLTYSRAEKWAEATDACLQAVKLDPDFADAWFFLGNIYGKSGRINEAIPAHAMVTKLKPEWETAWLFLGIDYVMALDPENQQELDQNCKLAISAFMEAIRLKPDCVEALLGLGNACVMSRRAEAGISAFEEVIKLQPKSVEAWDGLGRAYEVSGLTSESASAFRRARDLESEPSG